jgi:hypothetical protein
VLELDAHRANLELRVEAHRKRGLPIVSTWHAPIKGLLRQTAERGSGRAESDDAGTRRNVWAKDNPQPRGSRIGANLLSDFRRAKYQNSHSDREATSPVQRGATAGLPPSGYRFCQWRRLTKSFS